MRITKKEIINKNLYDLIGRVFENNCFPTLKGRLIDVKGGRCYFEILPNPDIPKYEEYEPHIEYLPETLVITMKPID